MKFQKLKTLNPELETLNLKPKKYEQFNTKNTYC